MVVVSGTAMRSSGKAARYVLYTTPEQCDFLIKEVIRRQRLSSNAILVIGALFVAVVFLLMAMVILALKPLSVLADDKQRYSVLR